jgi:arylsulfatase A-like enzyme
MHRLALAVLTTAVAAAPAALCGCAPRATPVRSVVLVVVDTLRADHMSLYGYSRPTTPALERATSRALIFDRAFATSPWTLPSFASIFTGSEPEEHGAGRWVERDGAPDPDGPLGRINVHGVEKHFTPVDESRATLSEILGRHGYATAAFANNPFLHPIFGLARGFDLYDHESGGDLSSRRADEMVSRTLAWIESLAPGEPFFAVLHLFDPHMAYDPPGSTAGRFTSGIRSPVKLPFVNTPLARRYAPRILEANRRFIRAAYDEEILFVDTQVGRLLDRLAKLPSDPLVVITADHGEELFDHESFGHGHTLYQELLHVPLLLLGPNVTPGHVDTSVSIADIAPTILDAVGIEVPRR